jgi:hypothetical protein
MIAPAASQDRGAGAVICIWEITLIVQEQTAACVLPRRPVDDAIDRAIVAMEDFVLANASAHPTRATLETFKRNTASMRQVQPQFCQSQFLEQARGRSPEQVEADMKKLLAVPREPQLNPCL